MPCMSSEVCATHEYCEPSTHQCHDCSDLCDPRYKTAARCSMFCPGIWKNMSGHGLGETKTSAVTVVTPAAAVNPAYVAVIVVLVSVVLCALIAAVVKYKRKKKKPSKEQIITENQTGLLNETKSELGTPADSRFGENQQRSSAGLERLEDTSTSLPIEESCPSPEDVKLNIEHGSKNSCFTDENNDNCGTEKDNNQHLPDSDETLPKISEDCLPASNSNRHLHSDAELCSAGTAEEEDVNCCYDLRSDPVQDNRNQFRQVMDAYHAIDIMAHDLPYVRQCHIGNNGLQVMITKDYSVNRASDEIMNIIPTNIPPDIVKIRHIS